MELWTIPAEELLQAGDVGLIPWVPLTDFADQPETMLQRCRESIEQHAPPGEKANLLAVTQVFSFLLADRKKLQGFANLHFTPAGSQLMGQHIAARILELAKVLATADAAANPTAGWTAR